MALRCVNRFYTVCYLVLSLILSAVAGISMDYYYGNVEPLRSASQILIEKCGTSAMRYECYEKCGINHACFLDLCFCIKVRVPETEEVSDEDLNKEISSVEERESEDFYENKEGEQQNIYGFNLKNDDEDFEDEREVLRHHIAHFCPNLDIARACIKQCMKLGLPAFCGKDHVCYCGHHYPSSKSKPEGNPKLAKNQFRDLYEKYFGKNTENRVTDAQSYSEHDQWA